MDLLRGGPNLRDNGPTYTTPVVRNGLEACTRVDGISPINHCVACALNL